MRKLRVPRENMKRIRSYIEDRLRISVWGNELHDELYSIAFCLRVERTEKGSELGVPVLPSYVPKNDIGTSLHDFFPEEASLLVAQHSASSVLKRELFDEDNSFPGDSAIYLPLPYEKLFGSESWCYLVKPSLHELLLAILREEERKAELSKRSNENS